MTQDELYVYLRERGIPYTAVEHPPAYTVEDIVRFNLPHPEQGARNLFLRDDKKRNYYLLTVKDETPVNLKDFAQQAGLRRLTFASETDLMRFLGLTRGAVTPFGVLNDESRSVHVYLDRYFADKPISVHPNVNTASIYLNGFDLFHLIEDHGNPIEYFEFGSQG